MEVIDVRLNKRYKRLHIYAIKCINRTNDLKWRKISSVNGYGHVGKG